MSLQRYCRLIPVTGGRSLTQNLLHSSTAVNVTKETGGRFAAWLERNSIKVLIGMAIVVAIGIGEC